jgi:hypothetical protein
MGQIDDKPRLSWVDFEQIEKSLNLKATNFEKIEYLNWLIHNSGIETGVRYYEDFCGYTPDIWQGIMLARAGMEGVISEKSQSSAYLEGIQLWREYCRVKQIKSDLEQGKPISFDGKSESTQQPAKQASTKETTLRKHALLLYYKGVKVTRINADKHLPEGYISASNLFKHYDKFLEQNARTGNCLSSREFKSLKRVFESVIKQLEGEAIRAAEQELQLLKQNNNNWQ